MTKRIRGVSRSTNDAARQHRKEPTAAEQILWEMLRDRQMSGHKFRRQQPLGPYIVDFCCAALRLVIEVDGESHQEQRSYDEARTLHLSAYGYRVMRFTNDQVLKTLDQVLDAIEQALEIQAPLPELGDKGIYGR